MLKPGMRVEELTKKVGQVPRHGKVKAVHGESIEVEWEDEHTSIVSRQSLHPIKVPAEG
ncbi:MAG: hypothetical protein OEP52_08990 [Acidimicrobiia bacterium]|nr:hypothetical protein [Acidimicrobiia bacterium]